MTEQEIKSLTKIYYSIGEVAKLFNINTSLIRFWEKEFSFNASKKTSKGNRLYTVKDIQNFNKIYHLVKEEGFTLEGAKKVLYKKIDKTEISDISDTHKEELIRKLEQIKSEILKLKNN